MAGKGKKRRFDRINAVSLLIIAASALFISIWQGMENRNFNKLSLKPYLKYDFANDSEGLSISIRNAGQGVAIVKRMQVLIDEVSYTSWQSALKTISDDIQILQEAWVDDEEIITPSERLVLIKMMPVDFQNKELKVRITFESIYEESQVREFSYSYSPKPADK